VIRNAHMRPIDPYQDCPRRLSRPVAILILLSMADDLLSIFLRDRDVPCPACAYNLRDLTTSRCPECGHGVALGVGLAERNLKAWVTLLVVCCLGAGTGLVVIALIIIVSILESFADATDRVLPQEPIGLALIAFLVVVPMTVGVLAIRRRFVRMRPGEQWTIVACAIVYVLSAYAFLFLGTT